MLLLFSKRPKRPNTMLLRTLPNLMQQTQVMVQRKLKSLLLLLKKMLLLLQTPFGKLLCLIIILRLVLQALQINCPRLELQKMVLKTVLLEV